MSEAALTCASVRRGKESKSIVSTAFFFYTYTRMNGDVTYRFDGSDIVCTESN